MDPLFPELPEDLAALSDDELTALLEEHEVALSKVEQEDEEYVGGLSADEILVGLEAGVEQIEKIRSEQALRVEAAEAYKTKKAELAARAHPAEETTEVLAEDEGDEGDKGDGDAGDGEGDSDADADADAKVEVEVPAQKVVVASVEEAEEDEKPPIEASRPTRVIYRRPPQPEADRQPDSDSPVGTTLVAAAGIDGVPAGKHLDRLGLAEAMIEHAKRRSRPKKHKDGVEEKILIAAAEFPFPAERVLRPNDPDGNSAKIRAIGNPYLGIEGENALTASGGLCAPLTPFYDIPDLAVTDRPVRDALPSFQAERGGVSVPSVSTIGDITSAIDTITEADDALGGTFATKSCQDLTCPTWTDVPVTVISHCREYGNLNARAWPEGIAHENNLTMAAHARTAEARLLDRIKALSINVTLGADTLSAWSHLVNALGRTAASVRYLLRLGEDVRFRALMPAWLPEFLQVDQVSAQWDRFMSKQNAINTLGMYGINPAFYLDTPSTGTSQGFSAETASAIDPFPGVTQIALFPEGTFLHLDGGTLELGLVRDSTLNSTNDYQVFGETFEDVARIGPAQAARWLSLDICPVGTFPALGTALACT